MAEIGNRLGLDIFFSSFVCVAYGVKLHSCILVVFLCYILPLCYHFCFEAQIFICNLLYVGFFFPLSFLLSEDKCAIMYQYSNSNMLTMIMTMIEQLLKHMFNGVLDFVFLHFCTHTYIYTHVCALFIHLVF